MAAAPLELLEREGLTARVEALLAATAAGGGGALVLEASAGLGKTRLLTAAAAAAAERGLPVARATGHELEVGFAWGGCVQLLDSVLAGLAPEERTARLDGPGAPAAALLDRRTGATHLDVDLPLLHAIAWVLAGGADRVPVVLLVDDAHWLDLPSLRAVHFVLGRLVGVGGALLVARRTGEPSHGDELLDRLVADPRTEHARLQPLGDESVAALVRRQHPRADAAFCGACARACQGNPLLLRQLLDELDEAAVATSAPDAVERIVPQSVTRAVLMRLERLGPHAGALARAAAVLPGGVALELVAALAELGPVDALAAVAALVRADVLRDAVGVGFVHPLVRRAVECDAPAPVRAASHARAAELLHDRGAGPEEVAAHLLLAAPGLPGWAADALRLAAARAVARAAPHSAIAYLERALQERLGARDRADVLVALGRAEAAAGVAGGAHLRAALDAARDPEEQAQLLGVLGWTLHRAGRFGEGTEAFMRGAALAPTEALRRELEAGQLVTALLSSDHQPQAGDQLSALVARPVAELSSTERLALSGVLTTHLYGCRPHVELRDRARALDVAGVIAAEGADVHTVWHLFGLLSWTDAPEVRTLLDAAFDDAQARGSVLAFAMASYARSWPRFWSADLDGAAADAQAAIDAWEGGFEMYLPAAAYWLTLAHLERGDLPAAEQAAARVRAPGQLDAAMRGFAHATAGHLGAARGDHARAKAEHLACADLMRALGMVNPSPMPCGSEAALAAFALGQGDEARALAADELARARDFGAPRALGVALRAHGLVTHDVEQLREAVALLDAEVTRLDHVRALVALGGALRRRGGGREARAQLGAALDLAHRHGARRLEEQARTELVAAGGRPRRAARHGRDALTPSEARVAALAAAGRTNREIAGELFVTVSTVEWHLKRVYDKLEVAGRHELPAALAAGSFEPVT